MQYLFSRQDRVLLRELVRTDFKLRYQGSLLGYAWSLLRPLFLFVILYLVFARFLKLGNDIPHYPIYLLLGIVLWNFFAEMTTQSLGSIVARGELIRKISIPRALIVLSTSISALINLGLNLIVVAVLMAISRVVPLDTAWVLIPVIIQIYILALGISFWLSALFVKYRDLSYVWEVFMQAAFYLTPIIYPLSRLKDPFLLKLLFINPMAEAIQEARRFIIAPSIPTTASTTGSHWFILIPLVLTVVLCISGIVYFRKQSHYFAENI